jgi:pyruvate,water dikinase
VILIDELALLFDGFSIGSNDLTQLTLGVDRDSDIVAFDFDERDPRILEMLRMAISGAKRNHRHIGICGEAPASYPEIAGFLTRLGIDSIGVNPSSILRTMAVVHEAEQGAAASEVVVRLDPTKIERDCKGDLARPWTHLARCGRRGTAASTWLTQINAGRP